MFVFNKSKFFLYSCLSFIVGVTIASFLPNEFLQNDFALFAISAIILVLTFLFWNTSTKKYTLISMFFLSAFFIILGIWRFSFANISTDSSKIWFYNGLEIKLTGRVTDEPNLKKSNQKITLSHLQFDKNNSPVAGKILVTTNLYPEFSYGDAISLTCKLKAPEAFEDFAYDKYLARYDVYSVCFYPKNIKKLAVDKSFIDSFYYKVFKVKNILRSKINQGMTEPEAGFARAMILGDMGTIESDLNNSFSRTGISHIVSISGSHIAVLIVILVYIFLELGFWRKHLLYLISGTLLVYIIMIGAPAAAVRSLIMGFMVLLGIHLGRISRLDIALVFAGALMLLFNPKLLRYDIGFQLSFLAVFAIVFLHPYFIEIYTKMADRYNFLNKKILQILFEIISISILIQVLTFPILFFSFKQFSLIAPLANLLILWTLPFLLAFLIAALILSFIFPSLTLVLFFPSKITLAYIIFIAQMLEKVPFAYLIF